jgi:hypothetical protein
VEFLFYITAHNDLSIAGNCRVCTVELKNSLKPIEFLLMAQFDSLIIFPLILSLLFSLFFYYNLSIRIFIPNFFGVKKFREKKFDSPFFYKNFNDNTKINLTNTYNFFFNMTFINFNSDVYHDIALINNFNF